MSELPNDVEIDMNDDASVDREIPDTATPQNEVEREHREFRESLGNLISLRSNDFWDIRESRSTKQDSLEVSEDFVRKYASLFTDFDCRATLAMTLDGDLLGRMDACLSPVYEELVSNMNFNHASAQEITFSRNFLADCKYDALHVDASEPDYVSEDLGEVARVLASKMNESGIFGWASQVVMSAQYDSSDFEYIAACQTLQCIPAVDSLVVSSATLEFAKRHSKDLVDVLILSALEDIEADSFGKSVSKEAVGALLETSPDTEVSFAPVTQDFSSDTLDKAYMSFYEYFMYNRGERTDMRVYADSLMAEFLGRYGFQDPGEISDIIKGWHSGAGRLDFESRRGESASHEIYENVSQRTLPNIIALEEETPGIVHTLYSEFGIRNFGRYPVEVLKRQYEDRCKDAPYGVVCFPYFDHNYNRASDLEQIDVQMRSRYGVSMKVGAETDDVTTLVRTLTSLRRIRDDSGVTRRKKRGASYIIMGAHGMPDRMAFGIELDEEADIEISNGSSKILTIANLEEGVSEERTLDRNKKGTGIIEPNAPIMLISCETGKDATVGDASTGDKVDVPGMAQRISRLLNTRVTAPSHASSVKSLGLEEAAENGTIPDFDVEFTLGEAVKYDKGVKVE